MRSHIIDWWEKRANTLPRACVRMAEFGFSINHMTPEELAQWLIDSGFDEEVGKAFVGKFMYGFVVLIKKPNK